MQLKLVGAVCVTVAGLLAGSAALAQETYRIGAVNSVTGPLGLFGQSVQKGTEVALAL